MVVECHLFYFDKNFLMDNMSVSTLGISSFRTDVSFLLSNLKVFLQMVCTVKKVLRSN